MKTFSDTPPWACELCLGCDRDVPLQAHDLTCVTFDPRTRIVVAWICDHCDLVIRMVGLYTSWQEAISAQQQELDRRLERYLRPGQRTADNY